MEFRIMLIASIALFALAAIFGLYILAKWLSRSQPSTTVVYVHGSLAVLGLLLFVIYIVEVGLSDFTFPLILFVLAVVLGLYVFYRDQFGDQQDIAMAIGHAILAVGGLMMLLFYFIAQ